MIEAVMVEGQPDAAQKRCFDCKHCKAAVSWWCTNKDAAKYRGTSIPGVRNCQFWEPMKTKVESSWFERIFGPGIISVRQIQD
jgi:hypothetical protein